MENKFKPRCWIHHREMEFSYEKGYYCTLCKLVRYNSKQALKGDKNAK